MPRPHISILHTLDMLAWPPSILGKGHYDPHNPMCYMQLAKCNMEHAIQ